MKIKRFFAGLTAASIAAMTSASITANAVAPVSSSIAIGGSSSLVMDPVLGDTPLLMIVIGYSNVGYDTEFDWNNEIFSGDYSLAQYYTDMSGGAFTFSPAPETSKYDGDTNLNTADKENDGIIHVTLDSEHADWSDPDEDEAAETMLKSFKDAVEMTDEYVDYASFDKDGNGLITNDELAISFVVAGREASYDISDRVPSLWAHQGTFASYAYNSDGTLDESKFPCPDNTFINWYVAFGERLVVDIDESDYHTDEIQTSSTLIHELGHYLGLADYYDTSYDNENEWADTLPRYFSCMDSGEWGKSAIDDGYRPFAMDTVSKMILGWANIETVTESGTYEIKAEDYFTEGNQHKALVIQTKNAGEYYVLEIRNNNKWDRYLSEFVPEFTKDGGIVIYHVDGNVWTEVSPGHTETNDDWNTINSTGHRPGLSVVGLEEDEDGKTCPVGTYTLYDLSIASDDQSEGNYYVANLFSKSMWEHYAAADLGTEFNLPMFGEGDQKDVRDARQLSGIKIEFLDDVGESMHVKITMPEATEDVSTPDSSSEDTSSGETSTPDSSSTETPSVVDETSSNNKITDTPVANTGAGAGLGAVAAVVTGALITVVSRKRKED